jgi:D-alanyl-D-alanine carboxypeptidase
LAAFVVAIVAACGSPGPTVPASSAAQSTATPGPTASAVPSAVASAVASASPSASPLESINPVPVSQLAAPTAPAAHLDSATAKALQTALTGVRAGGAYPGVSAAVVFPDGSVWTGQSGTAVLATRTAVAADTLFSIGSISKTFVAALAGRLASRGTISLDDPLSKYVPTFYLADKITLRQLLNHTSGIKDLFAIKAITDAILAKPAQTWTPTQLLTMVGKSRYPFAPGKGYWYSNTEYVLLGVAIEKATGRTVADLVRSEFLAPLGLDHTFLQTEEAVTGAEAHGYCAGTAPGCSSSRAAASKPRDNAAGAMLPFTAEASAVGAAGGFVSSAADIARWTEALYSGRVLDQATMASMVDISQTQGFKSPWVPGWLYGLGTEEATINGHVAWGHRGHLDGFWSATWFLPDFDVSITILTNAEWANNPTALVASLAKVAVP